MKPSALLSFLRNHPFSVEAFFESSLVLTYAVPKERLQPFLPPPLQLDAWKDELAFVAVAIVKTKGLRPKGFPAFMGNDFVLIGYRIFVRYTTSEGKRLRGLYILKSETDKKRMERLGNVFTQYRYGTTDVKLERAGSRLLVHSNRSNLHVEVDRSEETLPLSSPFADWKEARRFAGPLPFTFTFNSKTKEVLLVEGLRQNWKPQAVKVLSAEVGFLGEAKLNEAVLAAAFLVQNIPYAWKKGKPDKWKP